MDPQLSYQRMILGNFALKEKSYFTSGTTHFFVIFSLIWSRKKL
jgi:hypothetical protein